MCLFEDGHASSVFICVDVGGLLIYVWYCSNYVDRRILHCSSFFLLRSSDTECGFLPPHKARSAIAPPPSPATPSLYLASLLPI